MSAEENPYAPPSAELVSAKEVETPVLASRTRRFLAVWIDGCVNLLFAAPLAYAFGQFDDFPNVTPLALPELAEFALLTLGAELLIHGYLLHTRGQSIGKWLLDIRIERTDGSRVGVGRAFFLRRAPFVLLGHIPLQIGAMIGTAEVLMIFRPDQRCGHDLVADTRVVNLRPRS